MGLVATACPRFGLKANGLLGARSGRGVGGHHSLSDALTCQSEGMIVDVASYDQALLQAAREHAGCAFSMLLAKAPSDVELRTAAIHAGAAVEFLTKALVWEVNPLLVLEISDSASRDAFVAKRGVLDELDLENTHTVAASEALRLAALVAGVHSVGQRDQARGTKLAYHVFSARNKAAHMATSPRDPEKLADALAQTLRAFLPAQYCLEPGASLSPEKTSFLKDADLARELDQRYGAARAAVMASLEEKIDQARQHFEQAKKNMGKKLSAAEVEAKLREKAEKFADKTDAAAALHPSSVQDCPACGFKAVLHHEVVDVEMDEDGFYDVTYEEFLDCGCCGLTLNEAEHDASQASDRKTLEAMYDPEDEYF